MSEHPQHHQRQQQLQQIHTAPLPEVQVDPPSANQETIVTPEENTQFQGTLRRRAHRHHHTAGHGAHRHHHHHHHPHSGPTTPQRPHRHHHHHHHHHCCSRQVGQSCPVHGDTSVLRNLSAGTAPRSATFGSFPRQPRRTTLGEGEEEIDENLHPVPRTAPLPDEAPYSAIYGSNEPSSAGHSRHGQQAPLSRNLLRADTGAHQARSQFVRGTPAPSYHSEASSDGTSADIGLAPGRPGANVTAPSPRPPTKPARSYTDGTIGVRSDSTLTEQASAVPTFRTQARHMAELQQQAYWKHQSQLGSPHVHFMRTGTTTTQTSTNSATDLTSNGSTAYLREQQMLQQQQPQSGTESTPDTIAGLQNRDKRFSVMVDDIIRDPRMSTAERKLRKRKKHHVSLVDSVIGFDELTPGDLINNEGSKIDGGFGFALPSSAREATVLLDSRENVSYSDESFTSSRFSTDTTSTMSTALSNMFRRRGGPRNQGRNRESSENDNGQGGRSTSNNSTPSLVSNGNNNNKSSWFGSQARFRTPTSLSDRVNNSNLRPSQLDLNRKGARGGRGTGGQDHVRHSVASTTGTEFSGIDGMATSAWEDIQLDTGNGARGRSAVGDGKNDRLADSLGVRRPRRAATIDRYSTTSSSDLTVINEEDDPQKEGSLYRESIPYNEKDMQNVRSRYVSARQSDAEGYRQTMNLPPGLSQADIVAICLVQGMVPPGLPPDDTLVTWSGPLSPTNPRNWSTFSKWYACILVSWSTFLANAATNMIAPALGLMSVTYKELYIMAIRGCLIGSYIFAFTFSPLIFGPISEIVGRKPVLIGGMALFTLASLLSGLVTATWQLFILRFLAALGASAPMSIGGAVLTDIFSPDQRGRAMTVFALAPQLGPVLGPIMGGWVTQEARNWRWIFFISSIAGFIAAAPMLFVRESYTPQILAQRAERLRRETGNSQLSTIFERRQESKRQIMTRGVVRPFVLFSCEPIVQLLTVYVSLIYGIIHLMVATFPAVFGTIYSEYPGWASMHFIGIGVGTISGGFLGGYLVERHYHHLSLGNNGVAKPEFKFYCMLYTVWIPPLGLMIYGVITYFGIHWIFADLGIVIFCCGISIAVVAIQSYMVDCYALLAGSALTATIVFRSIVGTGATIGSEDLLLHAGMLWSNVALAGACIVIGVPAAYMCYFWGPAMRQKSRHATHKR